MLDTLVPIMIELKNQTSDMNIIEKFVKLLEQDRANLQHGKNLVIKLKNDCTK
jgi:hypothetical protein